MLLVPAATAALGWAVGRRGRSAPVESVEYVKGNAGKAVEEDGTPHSHRWGDVPYLSDPPHSYWICQDKTCRARMKKPLGWVPRGR